MWCLCCSCCLHPHLLSTLDNEGAGATERERGNPPHLLSDGWQPRWRLQEVRGRRGAARGLSADSRPWLPKGERGCESLSASRAAVMKQVLALSSSVSLSGSPSPCLPLSPSLARSVSLSLSVSLCPSLCFSLSLFLSVPLPLWHSVSHSRHLTLSLSDSTRVGCLSPFPSLLPLSPCLFNSLCLSTPPSLSIRAPQSFSLDFT